MGTVGKLCIQCGAKHDLSWDNQPYNSLHKIDGCHSCPRPDYTPRRRYYSPPSRSIPPSPNRWSYAPKSGWRTGFHFLWRLLVSPIALPIHFLLCSLRILWQTIKNKFYIIGILLIGGLALFAQVPEILYLAFYITIGSSLLFGFISIVLRLKAYFMSHYGFKHSLEP